MPPKNVSGKGGIRKPKRKAKSPLCVEGQCTGNSSERVSEQSVNKKVIRFSDSMNQNPSLNMNNCTTQPVTPPVMNYTPIPYGMPSPQTPQTPMSQYIPPPPPAHQPQGPPAWATEILEEIKSLKLVLPKLEKIENTVNSINSKIKELDTKVIHIETRVTEVENSCSFINEIHEKQSDDFKKSQAEVKKMQNFCKELEDSIYVLKTDKEQLKTKLVDLESRSMRENLLFYGIQENVAEDCETLIKTFCSEKLNIDASTMIFDRVHRIGGNSARKPRPIVAKFHYYQERERVRKKGYDCSDQLKVNGQGIGIQRPKAVREARKKLYAVMKREQAVGKNVRFIGDKLYVNGREYVDETV